jgi:tripartite-type tricarboxylate transporter receptor subunit TctC
MIMITRRRLLKLSAASLCAPAVFMRAASGQAQGWPNRIIRLILPFPAGGGADLIGRLVGAKLSEMWGQQIVIENRGGAGGNIASEMTARSAPDGYTFFLAGDFLSSNKFLYPKLSYDPLLDLEPVSLVVQFPTVIVVPNASPVRTIADYIAHAKQKGGALTYASPGHGTSPHLTAELFKRLAGIELTHVPYRGAAPALQDLVPGRVDSFFNNIAPTVALMKDGQIRGVAVSSGKRAPAMPDLPTIAESGFPGFDVPGWYAFFVPAKTPPEIIQRMAADTATALADPKVKSRLEENALFVVPSTPEAMGAYLRSDMAKWGPLIEQAGIKFRE